MIINLDIIDLFLFIENYYFYLLCLKYFNVNLVILFFRYICCFFNKWDVYNFIIELFVFDNLFGIVCF